MNSPAKSWSGVGTSAPADSSALCVVGTLAGPPDSGLSRHAHEVSCVEIRADLIGEPDPARLREGFSGKLLYTLRSRQEGGNCDDSDEVRRSRLCAAAEHYDLIDLEADRDLDADLVDRIEPDRRVISWHGPPVTLAELRRRFGRLAATPAWLYRLGPAADTLAQALVPMRFLHALGRRDVTAHARGPVGTWTRVLGLRFGAPVAFAWLDAGQKGGPDHVPPAADGALPVRRMLADYSLPAIREATTLYGIMSNSSFAPFVSNTAYRLLGLPALYLRFTTPDLASSLEPLRAGLAELELPLEGMCIANPHKEAALALADDATLLARRAGEATLLLRRGPGWWADSNAEGVIRTFARHGVEVAGQRAAVIGCGGAGRAAAAGLAASGAAVTLVNRGLERGRRAAESLGLPFVPLVEFTPKGYTLLVHATPLAQELAFDPGAADADAVILEMTYRTAPTRLITAVRAAGRVAISGHQVMLSEAGRQFELMTGHPFPTDEIEAVLTGVTRSPPGS